MKSKGSASPNLACVPPQWTPGKVPIDLRPHYGSKLHIRKSLCTRDLKVATREALRLALADDGLWKAMRSLKGQDLGLLPAETREAAKALLAKWGHEPGDRLKPDGSLRASFDNDTILSTSRTAGV